MKLIWKFNLVLLGIFIVGFVVVSQNMYAVTMEKLEEFATLTALGASAWYVRRIVLEQALISGLAGSLISQGLRPSEPLNGAANESLSRLSNNCNLVTP